MRVTIAHGPDRQLLELDADNQLVGEHGVPFHGIASRAAMAWLTDSGSTWEAQHQRGVPSPDLRALEVLTLTESAEIAARAAMLICQMQLGELAPEIDLWNIKEGHTASVWIASVPDLGRCILNVGRDPVASDELARVSEQLQSIDFADFDPGRIAEVIETFWIERRTEDVPTVQTDEGIGERTDEASRALRPVFVAVHAFVDDAYEIHRIDDRYLFIERFVTDPDEPAHITSVGGRWATDDEARQIDDVRASFEAVARPLGLTLTVNEGDLVWNDRAGPVIVAAGERPEVAGTGAHHAA